MSRILAAVDALVGLVVKPTVHSMAADFGPPPAVRYPALQNLTDADLIYRDRHDVIAEAKRQAEAHNARRKVGAR